MFKEVGKGMTFVFGMILGAIIVAIVVSVLVTVSMHGNFGKAIITDMSITGQAGYYDELSAGTYRVGQKADENTWVIYQVIPTADIPLLMCGVPQDSIRKDGTILKKSPAIVY